MSFENLLNCYLKSFNLEKGDFERIIGKFYPIYLNKGDLFCKAGERCKRVGVLLHGAMYSSTNGVSDERVTMFYSFPNNFIVGNFYSIYDEIPSTVTIRAYEASILMCIGLLDLEQLLVDVPALNSVARRLAEMNYLHSEQRLHSIMELSPKQRTEKFLDENNQMTKIAPKFHIASYLDINRNLYSKIEKSWKER